MELLRLYYTSDSFLEEFVPYLTLTKDSDVPIDNNRAENTIRPFTAGRKNWLFNNTDRGVNSGLYHFF